MITCRTPIMGNGREEKPRFAGLESPAIAHSELVASARFGTVHVPERDFPGNRLPPRWKFVYRPKEKSARGRCAWVSGRLGCRCRPIATEQHGDVAPPVLEAVGEATAGSLVEQHAVEQQAAVLGIGKGFA